MKLKDLLEDVGKEIKNDKVEVCKSVVKEKLLEIEELEKAIKASKKKLSELLDMDVEDFDVSVW